jgi:hypothetical protein
MAKLFKQEVQLDPDIEHSKQGLKHFIHTPDSFLYSEGQLFRH